MKIEFLSEGVFTPYKEAGAKKGERVLNVKKEATRIAQEQYTTEYIDPVVSPIINEIINHYDNGHYTEPLYFRNVEDDWENPKPIKLRYEIENGVLKIIVPCRNGVTLGPASIIIYSATTLIKRMIHSGAHDTFEALEQVFKENGNPYNISQCKVLFDVDFKKPHNVDVDVDILRFRYAGLEEATEFLSSLYLKNRLIVGTLDLFCTFSRTTDFSELKAFMPYIVVKEKIHYTLNRRNELITLRGVRDSLMKDNPELRIFMQVENEIDYNKYVVKDELIKEIFGMTIKETFDYIKKRENDKSYYRNTKFAWFDIPVNLSPDNLETSDFKVMLRDGY